MGDLLTAVPRNPSCVLVCEFDLCLDFLTVSDGPVCTLFLRKILDIDMFFACHHYFKSHFCCLHIECL